MKRLLFSLLLVGACQAPTASEHVDARISAPTYLLTYTTPGIIAGRDSAAACGRREHLPIRRSLTSIPIYVVLADWFWVFGGWRKGATINGVIYLTPDQINNWMTVDHELLHAAYRLPGITITKQVTPGQWITVKDTHHPAFKRCGVN